MKRMKFVTYIIIVFVVLHKIESFQMDFRGKMKLMTSNSVEFYDNSCEISNFSYFLHNNSSFLKVNARRCALFNQVAKQFHGKNTRMEWPNALFPNLKTLKLASMRNGTPFARIIIVQFICLICLHKLIILFHYRYREQW